MRHHLCCAFRYRKPRPVVARLRLCCPQCDIPWLLLTATFCVGFFEHRRSLGASNAIFVVPTRVLAPPLASTSPPLVGLHRAAQGPLQGNLSSATHLPSKHQFFNYNNPAQSTGSLDVARLPRPASPGGRASMMFIQQGGGGNSGATQVRRSGRVESAFFFFFFFPQLCICA